MATALDTTVQHVRAAAPAWDKEPRAAGRWQSEGVLGKGSQIYNCVYPPDY